VLPPGFSPPPHIHHTEDEAFYILTGRLNVFCGDKNWSAESGSFVFLPRGLVHGFSAVGDERVKILQITLPAGFEHFAREMGEPARDFTLPPQAPPDVEKLLGLAAKYGYEILGPSRGEGD
jgi:mannose-6-phosphate isomerase-like protein (cupin superfamily)